ncbi:Aste57867_23658 [Aphanomyces stellatus]|uniref:Aste57867_23658 protein n=1 Tax=Aphanomyces stellatus TaxID=120398 RepID=A0A485LNG5_9STRA|nr:hypothetical protein As57867_023586 [Aphanomyces stellatus]VFU00303.1 Aste57867_23658 [Aphanomyces stellatus]
MTAILDFFGDKDDDVNLSPDEVRRVFRVLGLDLTAAQVKLLDEIPIDEFMQTVDSQLKPLVTLDDDDDDETKPALPPTEADNSISYNQLHEFLQNCHLDIPHAAILDFLSGCSQAPPSSSSNLYRGALSPCRSHPRSVGSETLYLDKEGFHTFLQKYASQKQQSSTSSSSKSNKNRNKKRKAKAKKQSQQASPSPSPSPSPQKDMQKAVAAARRAIAVAP